MKEFEVEIIQREDPSIVAKEQEVLEERMDPGFWSPTWFEVLTPLLKVSNLYSMKNLVQDGDVISSDHVRASRGEHKGPEYPYGYYTVNGFMETGYATYALEHCDEKAFNRLRRSEIREGDILVAGSGRGSVGKVCFIDQLEIPAVVGDLYILRAKRDLVLPEYLTLFLKSKYGQAQIFRHETGVSGQTHIDKEELEKFVVPVLSDEVQEEAAQEFQRMLEHHYLAIDAASSELRAEEHQNLAAAKRYHAQFESHISTAEAMLNALIAQVEEVVQGKRTEIEPVDPSLGTE